MAKYIQKMISFGKVQAELGPQKPSHSSCTQITQKMGWPSAESQKALCKEEGDFQSTELDEGKLILKSKLKVDNTEMR